MNRQRLFRLLIFAFLVAGILNWAGRRAGREGEVKITLPEPVNQAAGQLQGAVAGVAASLSENEQFQGIRETILFRFQQEKEKIVEDQVGKIIDDIKSLPEEQLEEFKGGLCEEVCGE